MGVLDNLIAGGYAANNDKPITGIGQAGIGVKSSLPTNINEGFNNYIANPPEMDQEAINAKIAESMRARAMTPNKNIPSDIMKSFMETPPLTSDGNESSILGEALKSYTPPQQMSQQTNNGYITISPSELDRLVEEKVKKIIEGKSVSSLPSMAKLDLNEKNKPKVFSLIIGNSLYMADLKFTKKIDS